MDNKDHETEDIASSEDSSSENESEKGVDEMVEEMLKEVGIESTFQRLPGFIESTVKDFGARLTANTLRELKIGGERITSKIEELAKSRAEQIKKASLPEGVDHLFDTFPVDAKDVTDGNSFTVYVNASDPDLLALFEGVGEDVKETIASHGDRVQEIDGEEVTGVPLRIRLRGMDAPERGQDYGKEAHAELTKLVEGKKLTVLPYGKDESHRWEADIYWGDQFVQKAMMENGCAWYDDHDPRKILGKWQEEAKEKGIGLWAFPNPEEPWEWRKKNPSEARRA